MNKELLYYYYIELNKPQKEVAKIFNCSCETIRKYCRIYNIRKTIENINKYRKCKPNWTEEQRKEHGRKVSRGNTKQVRESRSKKQKEIVTRRTQEEWDQILEKRQDTVRDQIGVDNYFNADDFTNKRKRACMQKYGTEHYMLSKKAKQTFEKIWTESKRENARIQSCNYWDNKIIEDKEINKIKCNNKNNKIIEDKNLNDYNYLVLYWNSLSKEEKEFNHINIQKFWSKPNIEQFRDYIPLSRLQIIKKQSYQTKKQNNSFNTSKPEQEILQELTKHYPDIKYQYRSDVYPYNCDYYIPSLDLYIEFNGTWTHGTSPYNKTNPEHQSILQEWKEKAKKSYFYKNAIEIWTSSDPDKRKVAQNNNLNYIELWYEDYEKGIDHIVKLINKKGKTRHKAYLYDTSDGIIPYRKLEYIYSQKQMEDEFKYITNNPGDFTRLRNTNKIVLTYMHKRFYQTEYELFKYDKIRQQLVKNRVRYLSEVKNRQMTKEELTDKELIRGFKISGIHYGFSHFSPFWIKAFIEKYNIKSIYDPCAGWGHRLLGAHNIKYIANDIDSELTDNYKKIIKDFDLKDKIVYNLDATTFTPVDNYEAVFTCPPYFDTEQYLATNTSTQRYPNYQDWLNIWWSNLIQCSVKKGVKYFAFVISNKYKDDMKEICNKFNNLQLKEEIILGKNNLSHFHSTNTKKNNNQEILVVYQII